MRALKPYEFFTHPLHLRSSSRCYRTRTLITRDGGTSHATLVTGGTGLIGGEVILALARDGRRVRALVRADSAEHARHRLVLRLRKSAAFHPRCLDLVDAVPGDSTREDFGAGGGVAAGVRTIIHCAANTSFSETQCENIWATNVGGARHLMAVARRAAPQARVVFVSTASVVTAPEGACLSEDLAFAGHENAYTRSKREAERIAAASGLDVVIVRPSIVLSRGVDDREMARSILWALPIMNEIGDVPVDPHAFVDVVPVDFVAAAIVGLAAKPRLAHRRYHISAGRFAHTFGEMLQEVVNANPAYRRLRPIGAAAASVVRRRRMLRPVEAYLPFINASIRYASDRLEAELGSDGRPPASLAYVPELLSLISLGEAMTEMARP